MPQNTDKFILGARRLAGTIDSSGIINLTVDNFGLGSGAGLPTGTAVELTIDRVNANGAETPEKEEVICGVVNGDRIINAVRGVEGTAQPHSAGAVWEIRLTASQWNKLINAILVEHNQDGSHKVDLEAEHNEDGSHKLAIMDIPQGKEAQALINGDFDVWQRGTNFAGITASKIYTADRWEASTSGATITVSRQSFTPGQTDVPGNPKYFLRQQCTVADDNVQLRQKVEDVRTLAGGKAVFSFSARADVARDWLVTCYQYFGSGGSAGVMVTKTISLTTSWQRFEIVLDIGDLDGKTISGGDDYIYFGLQCPDNTTFTLDVARAKVNKGEKALPFAPKPFAEELRDSQRFYEKSNPHDISPGNVASENFYLGSTNAQATIGNGSRLPISLQPKFLVEKRAVPSVIIRGSGGVAGQWKLAGPGNIAARVNAFKNGFWIYNDTGGNVTSSEGESYGSWEADAEL